TADELGGLADQLRQEAARFKLRHDAANAAVAAPAGLTPEMLNALHEMMQHQKHAAAAVPASAQVHENGGNGKAADVIDRDERGYGGF
ncbi:MAG: hypothetical protein M1482_13590, partial [Chloroflexi bacterium]|nr:hypothetical protein [Chloroflexota bacterium]